MRTIKSARLTAFVLWSAAAGVTAALAVAPSAAADPVFPRAGSGPASDIVNELKADGYDVQVNFLDGTPNVPLNECKVSDIRNPSSAPVQAAAGSTVSVDIVCPNAK